MQMTTSQYISMLVHRLGPYHESPLALIDVISQIIMSCQFKLILPTFSFRCNYEEDLHNNMCDHPQKEKIKTYWIKVKAKSIRENANLQAKLRKDRNKF